MFKYIATTVFIAAVAVFAWMFRYEPLPSISRFEQAVYVFDRWTHNVCRTGFGPDVMLVCIKASSSAAPPAGSLSEAERLRGAGFTEQETNEYLQRKQAQGKQ